MIIKRTKSFLLRWRVLVPVIAVAIPVILGFVLGMLWLRERGLLLEYSIACAVIGFIIYVARKLPVWMASRRDEPALAPEEGLHVEADPDWDDGERRAYAAAQSLINARLVRAMPPEEIQPFAMEIITAVAQASGDKGKRPLDFTIPEALLLIERVSSRLRSDLRSHLPISDRVSVKTLVWLWQNQERARKIYNIGQGSYRLYRFTLGLPIALARELLDLVTSGNSKLLTSEMLAIVQRILFEEIAKAATELYSGRLRMSDAELLDSILADSDIDRQRLAAPDAPLRIAVAGQVSSGKSSLVNALLGRDAAETDMPPTTDRSTAHEGEIDGVPCRFIDLPGLDGSQASADATLREAAQCDVLLWALPINRPGREIDRATIAAIKESFREHPRRIAPPLVGITTFCDKIAGASWPYPEHQIPPEVQTHIGEAVRTIAEELKTVPPVPVSLADASWNTEAVTAEVSRQMMNGISVQRNRIRLSQPEKSVGREAIDTVQGLTMSLRRLGQHAAARYRRDR